MPPSGGSTNAVIHMLAIAGRAGIDLKLEDFDAIGGQVPCIVNCMPSGKYLIEDLAYAGGLPAVMNRISHLLHADAPTVMGEPISRYWEGAEVYNDDVIRPLDNPLREKAGIRVLKGNLAPNGAVIKPSAASPNSSSTRARPMCSRASRTSRPISTIPTCRSPRTRSWC